MDKYDLHPDLKSMARMAFPNIRITPAKLAAINALARLSCACMKTPAGIAAKEYRVGMYAGGLVRFTMYTPEGIQDPSALLVYFHGGGFLMRAFPIQRKNACEYARGVPCRVAFVQYRLAPRHPFPAGFHDCCAAYLWILENAKMLGIDPIRIAVGGESAGGALAAAAAHKLRDENLPLPRCQMLLFPATDMRQATRSMHAYTDVPGWNANLNRQMWKLYLKNGDQGMPAYASPALAASFSGLPPAYVETEEFDCLRDEGEAYAEALSEAGVEVIHHAVRGTFHGFDSFPGGAVREEAMQARIAALKRYLA